VVGTLGNTHPPAMPATCLCIFVRKTIGRMPAVFANAGLDASTRDGTALDGALADAAPQTTYLALPAYHHLCLYARYDSLAS